MEEKFRITISIIHDKTYGFFTSLAEIAQEV